MTIRSQAPKNLSSWQKKYGPGFVMYSTKSGRVLAAADDYKKLVMRAKRKGVHRTLDTSVIYVPSTKTVSIF